MVFSEFVKPCSVGIVAAVSTFISNPQGWIMEAPHPAAPLAQRFFMCQEIRANSLPFGIEKFRLLNLPTKGFNPLPRSNSFYVKQGNAS